MKSYEEEIAEEIVRRLGAGKQLELKTLQGGLGFPRPRRAGVAVAIGEQVQESRKKSVYWVLAVYEKLAPGEFIRGAAGLGQKEKVVRWFADNTDKFHMDIARRSNFTRIPVIDPPYLDEDAGAYIGTINDLQAQKRLVMTAALKARLQEVGATIPITESMKPQEIPLLMAVGGCLAGMERQPGYDPEYQRYLEESQDAYLDELWDDYR